MPQVAAGVALVAPDGQVLFVRRAGAGDHVGEWAFPGGRAEAGEDAETAARRECSEEVGYEPGAMRAVHRATGDAWDYTTHVHAVSGKFTPTLNDEHTEWKWADPSDGPQPQHPGVGDCLASDAWEESDHPRGEAGKFGSGGGGSGGSGESDDYKAKSGYGHPDTSAKIKLSPSLRGELIAVEADTFDPEHSSQDKGDLARQLREGGVVSGHALTYLASQLDHHISGLRDRGDTQKANAAEVLKTKISQALKDAAPAKDEKVPELAMDRKPRDFAFDKASVRSYDANGRLRIERANISKANVCGYYGEEIPGWEELGLDPRREYMMLRHPDALATAAPTFNSVPILDKHVPSTAWDHPDGLVIGTTGSDAAFVAPYLTNSLVFWTGDAIEDIENEDRQELSCGYAYRPVMEPGEYEGVPYDGVMLDIIGNHIALVRDGRAGPDVIVGDSQPQLKETGMPKQAAQPTATAQLVRGALKAHLPTLKLAKDAKVDLVTLLKGVSKKTYAADKARIATALKPKLANDADLDGVIKLLDALEGETTDDDLPPDTPPGMDADPEKMIMDMFKAKGATDEEAGALGEALKKVRPAAAASGSDDEPMKPRGMDADEPDDDEEKKKAKAGAMDEAKVKTLIHDAEQRTVKRMNATAEAREAVQPWVGKLSGAFDSAEGVYRSALDVLKVPHKGMHADALRPVLEAQPKPGEAIASRPAIVGDSADADAVNGFAKEFATHIRTV